jgi:hypothetical protein
MKACEKGIWDYTKLAHECLWKTHMGLHKYGTWVLVKKAYGTTQNWHMNVHEKDIWDYTKLAHEQLFLLFLGNFGNNVQHFAMQIFYFPTRRKMWSLEVKK